MNIDDEASAVFNWENWAKQLNEDKHRLRAEVASLKDELSIAKAQAAAGMDSSNNWMNSYNTITHQLAAANGRVERIEIDMRELEKAGVSLFERFQRMGVENIAQREKIYAIREFSERLLEAIRRTVDENLHLADGEVCTLRPLTLALALPKPWEKAALSDLPEADGAMKDIARWEFYRDNAMAWIDDMPLHEWIEKNAVVLGGRDAAIDAAIDAQEPKE